MSVGFASSVVKASVVCTSNLLPAYDPVDGFGSDACVRRIVAVNLDKQIEMDPVYTLPYFDELTHAKVIGACLRSRFLLKDPPVTARTVVATIFGSAWRDLRGVTACNGECEEGDSEAIEQIAFQHNIEPSKLIAKACMISSSAVRVIEGVRVITGLQLLAEPVGYFEGSPEETARTVAAVIDLGSSLAEVVLAGGSIEEFLANFNRETSGSTYVDQPPLYRYSRTVRGSASSTPMKQQVSEVWQVEQPESAVVGDPEPENEGAADEEPFEPSAAIDFETHD